MRKKLFAASLLFLLFQVLAPRVDAQSTSAQSIGRCSGGLRGGGPDCPPDHRLLIVVRLNGAAAPASLLSIVALAASAGGAFALMPANATSADSAVYAVLDLTRDASGNYRIAESTAGSRAQQPDYCEAEMTGGADDLAFGALLALETEKLVRCAHRALGRR